MAILRLGQWRRILPHPRPRAQAGLLPGGGKTALGGASTPCEPRRKGRALRLGGSLGELAPPVPGLGTVLASSRGSYWSSVPDESYAACLDFHTEYPDTRVRQTSIIDRYYGHSVRPVWQIDLSTLSGDYTAEDGVDLVGETPYTVTVPGGSSVTVNGVRIAGGGGTVNPAPAFEADGEAVTTKFEKGAGDTWAITAFAELGNDALGKDVADDQIKVYAAETVEGLESAAPMSEGVTVTDRKSAVKVSLEVETPPGDGSRFFRVGFGE